MTDSILSIFLRFLILNIVFFKAICFTSHIHWLHYWLVNVSYAM